jgi:hypothetical protein
MTVLKTKSRQKGLVMVEFAIVGLLFFIILFSILEFSRLLFVWNAVADATRIGARAAAVCSVNSDDIAMITRSDPAGTGNPILPQGIDASNIQIRYLDTNGVEVLNPDPVTNPAAYVQVKYVEVSIINYQHDLLIPVLGRTVTLPPFTTTRPREALGVIPLAEGLAPTAANQGC